MQTHLQDPHAVYWDELPRPGEGGEEGLEVDIKMNQRPPPTPPITPSGSYKPRMTFDELADSTLPAFMPSGSSSLGFYDDQWYTITAGPAHFKRKELGKVWHELCERIGCWKAEVVGD